MKKDNFKKIGHEEQLYSAREYRLCGGKADGMRMVELRNSTGLRAEIAADRALDVYRLEYKGINLGYMSPCGMVGPQYYQPEDFLRSFTAGFFTTCGLKNVGTDCEDDGELAVTHGRIGNTPADYLNVSVDDENEDVLTASGQMGENILFGEKLRLNRKIKMHIEKNKIEIIDKVTNIGGEVQPIEILYHMNMGYPLLDENIKIHIPASKTKARNARAEEGIDNWMNYEAPQAGFEEQCYFHTLKSKNGYCSVAVYNPDKKIGVKICFKNDTLDHFTEWKMPGVKDYVLGLEPSNASVDERYIERQNGELKFIEPGQSIDYHIIVTIIDGDDEYNQTLEYLNSLTD